MERVPCRRRPPHAKPDLLPIARDNDFCRRDDQGRLIITVKNQGGADADACTTRVDFPPHGPVVAPTPPAASTPTATSESPLTPKPRSTNPTRQTTPPTAIASVNSAGDHPRARRMTEGAEVLVWTASLTPFNAGS